MSLMGASEGRRLPVSDERFARAIRAFMLSIVKLPLGIDILSIPENECLASPLFEFAYELTRSE